MVHKTIVHYGGITTAVLSAALIWFTCFDILQVKEISMEPELRNGQTILVNKIAYMMDPRPSVEDIVVFNNPFDHSLVVKRIWLTEGDPINIDNTGWLLVGDQRFFLTERQKSMLAALQRVPKDCVLVLGDNPFHSVDSRDYGCVSVKAILGKVVHHQRLDLR